MSDSEARTTVRMDRELHKRLRIMAAMDEISMNDFILKLVVKEAKDRNVDRMMEKSA